MLVDRDPEVPARRLSLNQYDPSRFPFLNPSSHVTWSADDHRVQGDFRDRARWHPTTLLRHLLQRPMLVVEPARTLSMTFSRAFVK